MPTNSTTVVPEIAVNDAFQSLRSEILKQEEKTLRPLRVTPDEAMSRGLSLFARFEEDKARFLALYKNPPIALFESIRTRAYAVKGAALADQARKDHVSQEELEKAEGWKLRHLAILKAVLFDHEEVLQALQAIEAGSGYRDLGEDLVELAALESQPEHWKRIEATQLLPSSAPQELEALGVKIQLWSDSRTKNDKKHHRYFERLAWNYLLEATESLKSMAYPLFPFNSQEWKEKYPSLYSPSFFQQRKVGASSPQTSSTNPSTTP